MKLSFVIPLYNAENYIEQCLDSIFSQPLNKNDYEVIVIDDGSKDDSLLITKKIAKKYDNISVYRQKNKGVSATRNRGIDLAKGDYIWFIDSDDYIISNTANLLIDCLEKYNLDIVEFQSIKTDSRALNVSNHKNPSLSDLEILDGRTYASKHGYHDSCCTSIYKSTFLLKTSLRFAEGRVMEDSAFNAEIIPKANRIAYYPIDVYRYVINPNSIWTSKEPKAYRKSIEDFIFLSKKISNIIKVYEINDIDTRIIKSKQQGYLFSTSKRLLMSDYTIPEMNCIIKDLSEHKLYPLKKVKVKGFYPKLKFFIFKNKYLFLFSVLMYRVLRIPINHFIMKRHKKKQKKMIKSITNKK